jgi:hypothetical protein
VEEWRNTRFAVGGGTDEEGGGLETPDISEEEAQILSRHLLLGKSSLYWIT